MATVEVRKRMTRDQARRLLSSVPAIVSGRSPDPTGTVRQLHLLLGQTALMRIRQAFVEKAAGGADESGMRWEPLSESTLRNRRRGKGIGDDQILRDTGILLNSLSPDADGNIFDVDSPGRIGVGTNVPYAAFHRDGTGTIPARPLWPKPEDWPDSWNEDLAEVARDGVARLIAGLLGGA